MEFFAKCHTIVIPMASCRITTRQTLGPIGSVGRGLFCRECVKSYEYLVQDNTYYHDSSFGFMIKVKA